MRGLGDSDSHSLLKRALIVVACVGAIAVVGLLDYRTQAQITLSLFYVVPVALAAWCVGTYGGVGFAVYAIAVWAVADYASLDQTLESGVVWWNASVRLLFFLGVVLVVSLLRSTLAAERRLARHDVITGVANARQFRERGEYEVRQLRRVGVPLCVAIGDVDNLKTVNDTYGHAAGDALLGVVADTLRDTLRRTDLVSRLGGDEFGVLLPDTDLPAARAALEKARDAVNQAMGEAGWPATLSVGAVCTHLPAADIRELLAQADAHLYTVKNAGRNGLVVEAPNAESHGVRRTGSVSSPGREAKYE